MAILEFPMPTSVKALRSCFGLASYYKRFIPQFSRIAGPLHALTKKNSEFTQTAVRQKTFEKLRKLLANAPVLVYPDFHVPCNPNPNPNPNPVLLYGRGQSVRPPLTPIPLSGPFDRVGVDVMKFLCSTKGNQYVVVFMDYLTKWPEVFAVPDQTAATIARLLVEEIVRHHHGLPTKILSDRGKALLSYQV